MERDYTGTPMSNVDWSTSLSKKTEEKILERAHGMSAIVYTGSSSLDSAIEYKPHGTLATHSIDIGQLPEGIAGSSDYGYVVITEYYSLARVVAIDEWKEVHVVTVDSKPLVEGKARIHKYKDYKTIDGRAYRMFGGPHSVADSKHETQYLNYLSSRVLTYEITHSCFSSEEDNNKVIITIYVAILGVVYETMYIVNRGMCKSKQEGLITLFAEDVLTFFCASDILGEFFLTCLSNSLHDEIENALDWIGDTRDNIPVALMKEGRFVVNNKDSVTVKCVNAPESIKDPTEGIKKRIVEI